MTFDAETIERLSHLDLMQYAGDLEAIGEWDRDIHEGLMESPIEVEVVAERGVCEDELFEAVQRLQGSYSRFEELRRKSFRVYRNTSLFRRHTPCPTLITTLFDGVYIGDPEDVLNFRADESDGIMYATKGLGEKVAEVRYLEETPMT